MTIQNDMYIEELEQLILHTLLPIYYKYKAKSSGFERIREIDPKLLQKIEVKRNRLPALLRKKT